MFARLFVSNYYKTHTRKLRYAPSRKALTVDIDDNGT